MVVFIKLGGDFITESLINVKKKNVSANIFEAMPAKWLYGNVVPSAT